MVFALTNMPFGLNDSLSKHKRKLYHLTQTCTFSLGLEFTNNEGFFEEFDRQL